MRVIAMPCDPQSHRHGSSDLVARLVRISPEDCGFRPKPTPTAKAGVQPDGRRLISRVADISHLQYAEPADGAICNTRSPPTAPTCIPSPPTAPTYTLRAGLGALPPRPPVRD
jgi:hypothetical protein